MIEMQIPIPINIEFEDLGIEKEFAEILGLAVTIQQEKGPAYELNSGDKLYNFRTAAEMYGGTMMQHFGTHFWKHISAINSYIKTGGKLQSEPIERRIADAINYLCIFYKMVKEEERSNKNAKKIS